MTPLPVGRRGWLTPPVACQYFAGRGEEKAALIFCVTLWLPHLGQTAFASRSYT